MIYGVFHSLTMCIKCVKIVYMKRFNLVIPEKDLPAFEQLQKISRERNINMSIILRFLIRKAAKEGVETIEL